MAHVTDADVMAWEATISVQAHRFKWWGGVELDDLRQEGRIAVWQSSARGIRPSQLLIERRMRDWVRFVRYQSGVSYDTLLPMGDYDAVVVAAVPGQVNLVESFDG